MNEHRDAYIEVGFTALRDHLNGGFLPPVPLYIKAEDSAAAAEESLVRDIGKLLAIRMKKYADECRAAGAAV